MFRKNDQHLQFPLFSSIDSLPEKQLKRLDASWAGTFYREFFVRVDERLFAVLYSDEPSRPNIPVNVQFGLEMLKAGFGWSDEELYDAFCYNIQVRYALGYRDLSEGHFELRTLYNFRQRLTKHMQATGENLVEKAFEQITDEQIEAFRLSTKKLRMDSTMIASNIRNMSRLQLLVEVVQRVHRILGAPDQQRYAEAFAPYLKGSSGQYVYHLKGEESAPHIERIGLLMQRLVDELATSYSENPVYQVLRRVFEEHFVEEEDALRAKSGKELSASSLQSPDDWEATYRKKRGEGHIGYTANLTETCDPENDFQLIVKVQAESNNTDDAVMLDEVLPALKARLAVDQMWNDGGYNSPDVDESMRQERVEQIQTAIRGRQPGAERLGLADFDWETNADGVPQRVHCPHGQPGAISPGRKKGRYRVTFTAPDCADCPFRDHCPSKPLKRKATRVLRISQHQVDVAQRRRRSAHALTSGHNLRSAVEATVRSVKHPFRNGQVPVRGRPRVWMVLIGSAVMSNVRRIFRYQTDQSKAGKREKMVQKGTTRSSKRPITSSFVAFWDQVRSVIRFQPAGVFSC
jgi:hypothetical protein